ncbi:MAG: type II secretion system F family protein [Angustibacter sp.]
MTALVPAVAGALIVAGLLGLVAGLRPGPAPPSAPKRGAVAKGAVLGRVGALDRRTRLLLAGGAAAGIAVALLTGWIIAIPLLPAVAAGLPVLLSAPSSATRIDRPEAMGEWTQSLSSTLTAGVGLDQALISSLRSTPEAIRPEVTRLASRLRARWSTEQALRVFADELNDATGDLIVGSLILAARRRGGGVASVLEAAAESAAADVAARREIEADYAKPRTTARWVTLITISVIAVLALTGDYVRPYGTPTGQVLLLLLLGLYVATLVWMRKMSTGKPLPRFIGSAAMEAAR